LIQNARKLGKHVRQTIRPIVSSGASSRKPLAARWPSPCSFLVESMRAEFIDPGDDRWTRHIARVRHDIYHLPGYIRFTSKHEGGTPLAFYAERGAARILAPMLIREVPSGLGAPDGYVDSMAPYGYASPLVTPETDADSLLEFLRAFRAAGKERQLVCAFFRLHPLLPLPVEPLLAEGLLVTHGETIQIDLGLPAATLIAQTRRNHRADVSRLLTAGFRVERDDWDLLDAFGSIYSATMCRVSATEAYRLGPEYFRDMKECLGERLHLFAALAPGGEVAAAGLVSVEDGIAQYMYGGTADAFLRAAPSKLVLTCARDWAKDSGCRVFHLGGGLGARRDSLFHYKLGFSPATADFATFRMVLDEARYDALVHASASSGLVEEDPEFFPAYRIERAPHACGDRHAFSLSDGRSPRNEIRKTGDH
jgi:hypothetical protein